jgi:hypothetical protein
LGRDGTAPGGAAGWAGGEAGQAAGRPTLGPLDGGPWPHDAWELPAAGWLERGAAERAKLAAGGVAGAWGRRRVGAWGATAESVAGREADGRE